MKYLKLSKSYLKESKKIISLLILAIAVGVALVFSFQVAKRSQAITNMNYIKEISPTFHAEARNLDSKTTEKLKKNKNVKSLITFKNLGEFIEEETGESFNLNEYNEELVKSYKLNMVKGRTPKNSDEVVVKVDSSSVNNYKIGESISGYIRKEYTSNGKHNLHMKKKSFTVVGLVYPKYNTNKLSNSDQIYTSLQSGESLIPKEAIGYDSKINLNTGLRNLSSNVSKLIMDMGESQNTILENEIYGRLSEEVNSTTMENADLNKVVIASILFVLSMFNLFMRKRLKDIGLIRIIGGSKRGLSLSIIFENFLIASIGCVIGLILGYFMALYLNEYMTLTGTFDCLEKSRKLYIKSMDIILAIKIALISVSISMVIQLIAMNFTQGLDLIENKNCFDNVVEKINRKKRGMDFIKSLTTKLAFQNFSRNFLSMVISIIVVVIVTGRWIDVLTIHKMFENSTQTPDITRFQSREMEIIKNTYNPLYGINDSDIAKLSSIDGVNNILKLKQYDGYGIIPQNMISDELKLNPNAKNDLNEMLFTISGYAKDYFKDKDVFSSGGYEKLDSKELSIIITDKYYDRYDGYKFVNIFKNLKAGDVIKVKLPVVENGIEKYKIFDARIVGILNTKWEDYKDAPSKYGEVIFDLNKLKEITNSDTYTNVKFNASGDIRAIKSNFDEKNYRIGNIDDVKKEHMKYQEQFNKQLTVISIFFIIVAFTNMYCNIKGNIMLRRKEFTTLRAVGASKKLIYKMIVKESFIYSIICGSLGPIYGVLKSYSTYIRSVNLSIHSKGFSAWQFEIPIAMILIFFIATVLFCFIAVNISLKSILKENIVDGIRDEE